MANRLKQMRLTKVALVPAGTNPDAHVLLFKSADAVDKAEWTTATINDFPDASFAYVEQGEKDADGKTTPRSKRHLPYKDASGKPDAAHVRNALARLSQTDIPAAAKASAKRKLLAAAKTLGIDAQKGMMDSMPMPMDDDDADEPPPLTLEARQQQRQLWQQWAPLWSDFCETVRDIMDYDADDGEYADILMQSIEQFRTQAQGILEGLGLLAKASPLWACCDDVVKAGAVMAAGRKKRLQDAIVALQAILDEAAPKAQPAREKGHRMAGDQAEDLRKAQERMTALEAEITTLKTKYEPESEDIWKGVPEVVRKRFAAQEAALHAAESVAKAEREQREQTEYIQKTATYRAVGLAPDDWEVLKAIDTLPEKPRGRVLQVLKSATELLKQSAAFRELGFNGVGVGDGSVAEQVLALAKEQVVKGLAPSIDVAMQQVFKADGDLYQRYHDETHQRR